MDEEEIDEKFPEITITVTDEESEDAAQDTKESVQETDEQADGEKKQMAKSTEEGDRTEEEMETDILKLPVFDARRRSTLLEMDKKHAWLSELEEKHLYVETAFISKFQYVAVSNHYQEYLEELRSDESMNRFRAQLSNLFDKFRTAFCGSQRLLNKVSEIKGYKNITDAENRKLKMKLEDKNRKIEELEKNMDTLQNDKLRADKEKAAMQKLFSDLRQEKTEDSWKQEQVSYKS